MVAGCCDCHAVHGGAVMTVVTAETGRDVT